MTNKVNQRALGNNIRQSTGDMYNDCTIHKAPESGIRQLILKLQERISNEPAAGKFIEDLSDFMKPRPNREIIGLENKLVAGGREDEVDDAEYLKLKFSKRLVADELSESVQVVYAHILAYINSTFALIVKPLIRDGQSHAAIDGKVYEQIVDPIYNDVALADIGITADHIRGMLYYLTGNCYVRWH